ncbi:MAG: tellurite resistance TerB family protein [Elusimicrobiota bacterium]|jgi:hypothetical protein
MAKTKSCCETGTDLSSTADAIMAVAVLALSSDGKLSAREFTAVTLMASQSPLFRDAEDIRDCVASVAETVARLGREDALAQAVELLSPRMRETAYAWAVQTVLADAKVLPNEHKFLSCLRKALGLHGILAGKIAAVVAILNRVK